MMEFETFMENRDLSPAAQGQLSLCERTLATLTADKRDERAAIEQVRASIVSTKTEVAALSPEQRRAFLATLVSEAELDKIFPNLNAPHAAVTSAREQDGHPITEG